jgi:parallel beta-helix repeat protein
MGNKSKSFTLVIVALFIISLTLMPPATIKVQSKTIIVPDDYPTIQEAVNNASAGTTIFVRSGNYSTQIVVRKPLSLIGEDPDNTIIETPKILKSRAVSTVEVFSENVTISGFTIKNSYVAIAVFLEDQEHPPSQCKIIDNKIITTGLGISIKGGQNHVISGNYVAGSSGNAFGFDFSNSLISGNYITGNRAYGIVINSGENVTIYNNTISKNAVGIGPTGNGPLYIHENNIKDNQNGIKFAGCNNVTVYKNNIARNIIAVKLVNHRIEYGEAPGSGNILYQNNFIKNSQQVVVDKKGGEWIGGPVPYFPWPPTDAFNGTDFVSWYKDKVGNYWSDYIGQGSYVIDQDNVDNYPLTQQVDINSIAATPTINPTPNQNQNPTSITIAVVIVAVIVIVIPALLLLLRRHQKPISENKLNV